MGAPQILQVLGLLTGFVVAVDGWHSLGGRREEAVRRLVLAAPLVFVGGKGWYLAENRLPPTIPNLFGPGYSLYGSIVLVLVLWVLWNRLRAFPLLPFLDAVTPAAAIGLVFGRLSCFLRGCCSGLPTGDTWGVRLGPTALFYPEYVMRRWIDPALGETLPLHPTQLYEAVFALVAFIVLRISLRRSKRSGQIFLCGVLAYGLFRFVLEYFRIHDSSALMVGRLYLAQWISLGAAGLAVLGLWFGNERSATASFSAEQSD